MIDPDKLIKNLQNSMDARKKYNPPLADVHAHRQRRSDLRNLSKHLRRAIHANGDQYKLEAIVSSLESVKLFAQYYDWRKDSEVQYSGT